MPFIRTTTTSAAVLAVLWLTIALWAAPTKPVAKSDSKVPTEDLSPEVPAVPYLTLTLARDPSVHKELGLKPQQADNLFVAIAEVDEQFWQLRDVPIAKCGVQLDALHSKLVDGLKRELTRSQLDRLNQIILQGRSWKALASPDLAEKLKLTSDQVALLRIALKDAIKERESTEKEIAGKSSSTQEQARSKLRESESRRFTAILKQHQQADYRKLLGQSFDFSGVVQVGCVAPELRQVTAWINSEPITLRQLRGKVVVVHFWAFGCINCIRNLPHYQSWYEQFRDKGVMVVGIHTPETDSEKQIANLRRNVIERKIEYPVVFDAASENWKAWGNNMWPSVYLIDKQGRVRNWWYGELNWEGAKGEEFLRQRSAELRAEK